MQNRPKNFAEIIAEARKYGPRTVAVAAAHDVEVLKGIKNAEALGLVEGILIGDKAKIVEIADGVGYAIPPSRIIDEPNTLEAGRKAVEMVGSREAHLLMKGKTNTAELIRLVLDREMGLRTGHLLSQVVVFETPGFDRLMLLTDAAINIAPSLAQKAEICRNAIEVAQAIGISEPRVAILAAFEFVNPDMPATVDAAALVQMARRDQIQGAIIDGPLALDIAVSSAVAEQKGVRSPVAGAADIFIAPDIEAANIFYRSLTYFAGARSGGLVVGAAVPLLILSRAEMAETKVNSIAIALLLAKAMGQ
ncbi:MAG: bifunctional enoyl-CoA hydratase/phosphate acetyltransferase [Chloroflexi bacterium]|nr:bifunctional enoyl-CoA hydratase/phosphate acetyltransferase [Chloroflexota bacterium]MCL5076175.1 bifunctional enoyl-CoA hydratase/phosphate acetyltransferase [Chloroflexota bacterium]